MYEDDKDYRKQLPSTKELLNVCDKAFVNDDEIFIEELALFCIRELDISWEIAFYKSKDIQRSRDKTILTEKIRIAINNYRLKCGVLTLDYMYYKTPLFNDFINEVGIGETSSRKIGQFKKDHPEYVKYLSERHFASLMKARAK